MSKRALSAACAVALLFACDGDEPGVDGGATDAGPGADADVALCAADGECEDGLFCTVARCLPGDPGADLRGCVDDGDPCAAGELCDEVGRACSAGCATSDADGDGHEAIACGGDDCDDADADRYPGNPEVCDAEGHDEDCVDETWGGTDEDDDSVLSSACCFGDSCGLDCDDSDAEVFGGATEVCNTVDDDCDGVIDGATAFCPFGICSDSRCRASAWARAFGGGSGGESIFAIDTDQDGNIYLLAISTSDDRFPLGDDSIGPGVSVISFEANGRYRWHTRLANYRPTASTQPDRANAGLVQFSKALVSPTGTELVATRAQFPDDTLTTLVSDLRWFSTEDASELRAATVEVTGADSVLVTDAVGAESGVFLSLGVASATEGALRIEHRDWSDGELITGRDVISSAGSGNGLGALAASSRSVVALATFALESTVDGTTIPAGTAILRFAADLSLTAAYPLPAGLSVSRLDLAEDGALLVLGSHTEAVSIPAWGESWPAADESFVVVLDADGTFRWANRQAATFSFAHFDARGGVAVGGSFDVRLNVGLGLWAADGDCADGFLVTLDEATGAPLSGRNFPGSACESITAMAVDPFGATILGGTFTDRITVGGSTYASSFAGRADAFVVRAAD